MSFRVSDYTNINTYTTANQTYIDKYDKSLKLPFLNILQNNISNEKTASGNESETDSFVSSESGKIAISSAVVRASPVSDIDTGDATYA